MRNTFTLFSVFLSFLFLLGTVALIGQNLATWTLDNNTDEAGTSLAAGVTAGNLVRGNGVGDLAFSTSGVAITGWATEDTLTELNYLQICLTPAAGTTINVSGLTFEEARNLAGPRALEIYWSANNFVTSDRIDSLGLTGSTANVRQFSGLDINVCDGQPICFRFNGYDAVNAGGTWNILKNTLAVQGSVLASCTPPTTKGSLAFSNLAANDLQLDITHGNGDSRLVVMRKDQPVTTRPCSGMSYAANTTFKAGENIGYEEYVVYNGTDSGPVTNVTITGLEEGATYYFAAYEYFAADNCYLQHDPAVASQATTCVNPTGLKTVKASAGNGAISFLLDQAYCADEVLVVASTAPVTGTPTGDGSDYSPDLQYGNGAGPGFSGTEFPVYLGPGNGFTVAGLANDAPYFFRFFTRMGTKWSTGVEVEKKATAGCSDLGGNDVVFINEIHYVNAGADQDEGVELAGPAGVDLSAYEIYIYQASGGFTNNARNTAVFKTTALAGTIDNEKDGFGAKWIPIPDLPDDYAGIVLYNRVKGVIVQFLGYRTKLYAIDGVAIGLNSDPLVTSSGGNTSEYSSFSAGNSLQLDGAGACPGDFVWHNGAITATRGVLNSAQTILPIELLSFQAKPVDQRVLLYWETALEINNDYMAVERSGDGRSFTEIGRVRGAGTTAEPQQYDLWDEKPLPGLNYYRLRQVDFDGSMTYHEVVVVRMEGTGKKVEVYPTLVTNEVTVLLAEGLQEDGEIQIYDLNGQLRLALPLAPASLTETVTLASLNPGYYLLRVVGDRQEWITRLVKM